MGGIIAALYICDLICDTILLVNQVESFWFELFEYNL